MESVLWSVSNGMAGIQFVATENSTLGKLVFPFIDMSKTPERFGISSTSSLLKMLSIMENNINISFLNEQFTYMNMLVSDEIYKGSFSLADIHNLPEVPDIVEPKAYELSINIDKTFKDQYLKAYRALGSTNRFTIQSDGNIKFTLGNKESYANKVSFEKESDESLPLTPKSFSGEAVAAVLENN